MNRLLKNLYLKNKDPLAKQVYKERVVNMDWKSWDEIHTEPDQKKSLPQQKKQNVPQSHLIKSKTQVFLAVVMAYMKPVC